MDLPEVPKVLFIRGVFKHQARAITEIIEDAQEEQVQPLRTYEEWNEKDWLEQRAVRCTTCPRQVGPGEKVTRPIFIPEVLEATKRGTAWKVHDTVRFCSWPCAQFHIVNFLKNDNRYSLRLKHLHKKWTGLDVDEICMSEPPWRCIELGGDRTVDDFHRINEFNMTRLQSSFETESEEDDNDE